MEKYECRSCGELVTIVTDEMDCLKCVMKHACPNCMAPEKYLILFSNGIACQECGHRIIKEVSGD